MITTLYIELPFLFCYLLGGLNMCMCVCVCFYLRFLFSMCIYIIFVRVCVYMCVYICLCKDLTSSILGIPPPLPLSLIPFSTSPSKNAR
jgi:hypothetical protein